MDGQGAEKVTDASKRRRSLNQVCCLASLGHMLNSHFNHCGGSDDVVDSGHDDYDDNDDDAAAAVAAGDDDGDDGATRRPRPNDDGSAVQALPGWLGDLALVRHVVSRSKF